VVEGERRELRRAGRREERVGVGGEERGKGKGKGKGS